MTTTQATPTPPTQAEILERYEARKGDDYFGFEVNEYIEELDFEHAKPYLMDDVTPDQWKPPRTRDEMLSRMKDYMEFAWGKANDQRGISANRSIQHYIAWTWLAGDRSFSEEIDLMYETNYHHYGKPILERICQFYGWDWSQWDDGERTNG